MALDDNLPYSIALKAESNLLNRVAVQLGANLKKSMHLQFYVENEKAKIEGEEDLTKGI